MHALDDGDHGIDDLDKSTRKIPQCQATVLLDHMEMIKRMRSEDADEDHKMMFMMAI